MAKRRILKREVADVAGELFAETLFCSLHLPNTDKEKADQVMTRILDMQDNFICRISHPDGKDNSVLVKAYYKKLKEDLQKEVNAIAEEIRELSK